MISSSAKFSICSYPYNYLIIEDCFETNAAYGLSSVFNDLIRSGRSVGKVGEVGDLVYDAINFTPTTDHVRNTPIANIASVELKALIADVFQIQLDDNVMIGMHRHNPPSKPGWTHTDFAVVSFPNVPPTHNGLRVYYDGSGCNYSDDSKHRQPETIKTARSIACLYYSANADWKPGMGGGTAFIGRSFCEALVQKSSIQLTLLNRGVTNPALFPSAERLRCDRNQADQCKQVLQGKHWESIVWSVDCIGLQIHAHRYRSERL